MTWPFIYIYSKQKKAIATNKCTSVAGRFDGHVDALKQYMQLCPLKQIQGRTRFTWTPRLFNYSLHIASAATSGNRQANNDEKMHFLYWSF
jgi:hypothetical protein